MYAAIIISWLLVTATITVLPVYIFRRRFKKYPVELTTRRITTFTAASILLGSFVVYIVLWMIANTEDNKWHWANNPGTLILASLAHIVISSVAIAHFIRRRFPFAFELLCFAPICLLHLFNAACIGFVLSGLPFIPFIVGHRG